MGMSHYGRFDGVTIGGLSTLNAYPNNVYWLDSAGGGGSRGTFAHPFTTLDDALGHCDADEGDVILVKPKHAETLTGAGGLTLDKAGVSIIGLGRYDARPRFLMDGDAITGLITGANASIQNCVFAAGHSDVACCFLVTAVGFELAYNHFERNTTNENFVNIVNAGAVDNDYDGLALIGNTMDFGTDAGELTPINLLKNSKDVKIIGNRIYGDFDTTPFAAIYSVNTEDHMAIDISYNHIHNLHDADSVVGISVGSATSTGFMYENYVYALDIAGATPFVTAATGISVFNNRFNYTGSTSSAVIAPAIGTLS